MGSGASRQSIAKTIMSNIEQQKIIEASIQKNSDYYVRDLNEEGLAAYQTTKKSLDEIIILINQALECENVEDLMDACSALESLTRNNGVNKTQWKLAAKAIAVDLISTGILTPILNEAKRQFDDNSYPRVIIAFFIEWADASRDFSYELCKIDGSVTFFFAMLNKFHEDFEVSRKNK